MVTQLLTAVILFAFSPINAFENSLDQMNDLAIESEIGEWDLYDEEIQYKETQAETKRLKAQTRQLKGDIKRLQKKNKGIQAKTQHLHRRYAKSAAILFLPNESQTKPIKLDLNIIHCKGSSTKFKLRLI